MKTVAELKRDANGGKMSLEMIEWYGKTGDEIKETLRGIRKVLRANTVAIILLNRDGNESEMRLNSAKLGLRITDNTLSDVCSGATLRRPLT